MELVEKPEPLSEKTSDKTIKKPDIRLTAYECLALWLGLGEVASAIYRALMTFKSYLTPMEFVAAKKSAGVNPGTIKIDGRQSPVNKPARLYSKLG